MCRAVLIEAYKPSALKKKCFFKKKNKLAVSRKTIEIMQRREKEQKRMEFNYTYLPGWAVENHREKLQAIEDAKVVASKAEVVEKERRLKKRISEMETDDQEVYEEDCAISEEVIAIMRRCGIIEGVNAGTKEHILPPIKPSPEKLTIALKHNVDFSMMTNPRTKHEYYYPFDHEISAQANDLRVLKARGIGERGALCLSADFVRNQLPQLEILDLSNCEMKTRGMGRVLRGVKLAKYRGLETLILRGNHITCRGLEYVRDLLDSDLFENITVVDLGDNELGDECAEYLIRMVFAGSLKRLHELHLQNNGITDIGFSKLMKILRSVYMERCPNLERLGLERNPITPEMKREMAPLPPMVSV
jgi:hypothetical protein